MEWHLANGIRKEKLRFHEHGPDELAHYAKKAFDIEYEYPFGWKEFEGVHNRTDFDLSRHQEYSGKRLEYIDALTNERYIPYVVETAVGVDRTMLVALIDGYREETGRGRGARGARAAPKLAPDQGGGLPADQEGRLAGARDKMHYGAPEGRRCPSSTTMPARSAAAIAARTRPARLVRDGGRADGRGRHGHDPRPRQPRAGACGRGPGSDLGPGTSPMNEEHSR
jgi:hypothetical protein